MTAVQRSTIKKKILSELERLNHEIEQLQELTKPIPPECALGDLARFERMNDQRVSETALHEAQSREKRLKYALSHVEREDFGQCLECEEAIPVERLLLLPESTHCITCASERD